MINLLPPQQQKELRQYQTNKIIIILGFVGIVFLVALALVLLTLNIHLQGEVDYQSSVLEAKRGKSKTSQIETLQQKFSNYNQKATKLRNFYEKQDHPSKFLKELDSVLLPSVYLTSLSYDKSQEEGYKAEVNLSGYSPTRQKLFELKEKMDEKSEWENLKLPPSNWVKPTDINFKISFKIKSGTEK